METLRGLLALLCVFLAGAQLQTQTHRLAGKFAETMLYFPRKSGACIWFMALCRTKSALSVFECNSS